MKTFIKEGTRQIRSLALLYMIIGISLLIFHVSIITTLISILGWILLAFALYNLYLYLRKTSGSLFLALPFLVLGFLFVHDPGSIIGMISLIIGLVLIINGVTHLQSSLVLREYGSSGWIYSFLYSLLIVVIGIVLLTNPISAVRTVLKICGIVLIVHAVCMWFDQYRIQKLVNDADAVDGIVEGEYKEMDE